MLCTYNMRTYRSAAHMRGLVPATNPLKNWHERTGHRDLSCKQFTRSILTNKSQRLVPTIQTGLNLSDQSQGPKLVSVTRWMIPVSPHGEFTTHWVHHHELILNFLFWVKLPVTFNWEQEINIFWVILFHRAHNVVFISLKEKATS